MGETGNPRTTLIRSIAAAATEWRRDLHRHPQTMYEETFARDLVCRKLTEWGILYEREIAVTGVVATVEDGHTAILLTFRRNHPADLPACGTN